MTKKKKIALEREESFSKKKCSKKTCDIYLISQRGFTFLISFMILFQLFLMLNLFPDNFMFELPLIENNTQLFGIAISIILNFVCLFFIGSFTNQIYHKIHLSNTVTKIILWSMIILFLMTCIGYLEAKTAIENYLLSTISFILAYFVLMIILEDKR